MSYRVARGRLKHSRTPYVGFWHRSGAHALGCASVRECRLTRRRRSLTEFAVSAAGNRRAESERIRARGSRRAPVAPVPTHNVDAVAPHELPDPCGDCDPPAVGRPDGLTADPEAMAARAPSRRGIPAARGYQLDAAGRFVGDHAAVGRPRGGGGVPCKNVPMRAVGVDDRDRRLCVLAGGKHEPLTIG